jgi:hypothetical protein
VATNGNTEGVPFQIRSQTRLTAGKPFALRVMLRMISKLRFVSILHGPLNVDQLFLTFRTVDSPAPRSLTLRVLLRFI